MKKVNLLIMAGVLSVAMMGCTSVEEAKGMFESSETAQDDQEVAESADNSADQNGEKDSEGSELFEAFLAGSGTLSFDYYKNNVFVEQEFLSYEDETVKNCFSGKEYTLRDMKDSLNKYYEDGVEKFEYAYIDCGADGEKEMALRIQGPFVEPGSSMTYVIKEMNSQLQVVYAYDGWSRSSTDINEYGFITGGGSNGATNHGYYTAYVNADGKYSYGYYEEEEADIEQFEMIYTREGNETPQYKGQLCFYTLRMEPYDENSTNEEYYSYAVYDSETFEEMIVPGIYTDSPYKTIADSFNDIKFITMDEVKQKEEEKLEKIGVTEQIKNGEIPEYTEVKIK